MRKKLTTKEQIEYMKNNKGILFNIVSEDEAINFLNNNNYYFKIKAYAKNYDTYRSGEKQGKYINVEFAYLQELSRIDMYIRKFIIKMTLDIEHFAKTKLMRDLAENNDEDGYSIVEELFDKYPYIKENIYIKSGKNSICKDLIDKYSNDFAAWNIIEVLSFGDFINLYLLYYEKYSSENSMIKYLWSVKFLRNAAAHNSCLINSLKKPYTGIRKNKNVNTYVSKIDGVKSSERIKKMSNPIIHDFVVTLFVFNNMITSKTLKKATMEELKDLVDNRFTKNKEYFGKNQILLTNYKFIKKIVDYFYDLSI